MIDFRYILRDNCRHCYRPTTFDCASCRLVRYCSRECQAADWVGHRGSCGEDMIVPAQKIVEVASAIAEWGEFRKYVGRLTRGSSAYLELIGPVTPPASAIKIPTGPGGAGLIAETVEVVVRKLPGKGRLFIGIGAPADGVCILTGTAPVPTRISPTPTARFYVGPTGLSK